MCPHVRSWSPSRDTGGVRVEDHVFWGKRQQYRNLEASSEASQLQRKEKKRRKGTLRRRKGTHSVCFS